MVKIDCRKYKKIQELLSNTRFRHRDFTCGICGKELKCFHGAHLKKHDTTKEAYIEEFGFPNKSYEQDYITDKIIDKLYDLYIYTNEKWLHLNGNTRKYATLEKGQPNYKRLCRYHIREHLQGKNTIGVFSGRDSTKFMVFDIDTYGSLEEGKELADAMINFLSYYFPENQIHVIFSGKKGFHLTLYFDNYVVIKDVVRVFNIVLNEIGVDKYDVNVELRPEARGILGRGIKLPCGVNFLNNDDFNNYCYYLDKDWRAVEYEIEYLLNIVKSDAGIINCIIEDYQGYDLDDYGCAYIGQKKSTDTRIEDNDLRIKAEKEKSNDFNYSKITWWLENGLEAPKTRHDITFKIAMLLKKEGYSRDEAFNTLMDWSIKQIERGYVTSLIPEIQKDILIILDKGVYSHGKNYSLYSPAKTNNTFTKNELKVFEEINAVAKSTGKSMVSQQKIMFALMVHAKRYANSSGEFFMTYAQISALSDVQKPATISKCITELEELGLIKLITRNKVVTLTDGSIQKLPNTYKLQLIGTEPNSNDKVIYKICNKQILCDYCINNMFKFFYESKEIDKAVTRKIKNKINKSNFICNNN